MSGKGIEGDSAWEKNIGGKRERENEVEKRIRDIRNEAIDEEGEEEEEEDEEGDEEEKEEEEKEEGETVEEEKEEEEEERSGQICQSKEWDEEHCCKIRPNVSQDIDAETSEVILKRDTEEKSEQKGENEDLNGPRVTLTHEGAGGREGGEISMSSFTTTWEVEWTEQERWKTLEKMGKILAIVDQDTDEELEKERPDLAWCREGTDRDDGSLSSVSLPWDVSIERGYNGRKATVSEREQGRSMHEDEQDKFMENTDIAELDEDGFDHLDELSENTDKGVLLGHEEVFGSVGTNLSEKITMYASFGEDAQDEILCTAELSPKRSSTLGVLENDSQQTDTEATFTLANMCASDREPLEKIPDGKINCDTEMDNGENLKTEELQNHFSLFATNADATETEFRKTGENENVLEERDTVKKTGNISLGHEKKRRKDLQGRANVNKGRKKNISYRRLSNKQTEKDSSAIFGTKHSATSSADQSKKKLKDIKVDRKKRRQEAVSPEPTRCKERLLNRQKLCKSKAINDEAPLGTNKSRKTSPSKTFTRDGGFQILKSRTGKEKTPKEYEPGRSFLLAGSLEKRRTSIHSVVDTSKIRRNSWCHRDEEMLDIKCRAESWDKYESDRQREKTESEAEPEEMKATRGDNEERSVVRRTTRLRKMALEGEKTKEELELEKVKRRKEWK